MPDVIGRTCPFCQAVIKPREEFVLCSQCQTVHHRECWDESARCTTPGCAGLPTAPFTARRHPTMETPIVSLHPPRKSRAGAIWTTLVVCVFVAKAAAFFYSQHQKGQRDLRAMRLERVRSAARQRASTPKNTTLRDTEEPRPGTLPLPSETAPKSVVHALKSLNARLLTQGASGSVTADVAKEACQANGETDGEDDILNVTVTGLSDEWAARKGREYGFTVASAGDMVRRFYLNIERISGKSRTGRTVAAGDNGTIWYLGGGRIRALFKGGLPDPIANGQGSLFLYVEGLERDPIWPVELANLNKNGGD